MIILDLRARALSPEGPVPELVRLPDGERTLVVSTWRQRMLNEHLSARVFEALEHQARAVGLDGEPLEMLGGFPEEERTHARRCAGLLASWGVDAVVEHSVPPSVPEHAETGPRAAFLRNLLSVCCLSETVAVAQITAERERLEPGGIRATLTTILSDEIGHARLGWRILEREELLGDEERRDLNAYLPTAFAALEAHQLEHVSPLPAPGEAARFGACDGVQTRELFYDTVEHVIVPRLEHHGLNAKAAWTERRTAAAV